ncbi:hypothetical protein BEWA_002200 [Theileria equi strain WA]|uniref:Signal peptide-containing protein n=1 Tax=Theileria equi strain WA TaxID=1537102 RepID=L0AZX9_THEEQ|nr:hypothetical protein BEWA_002200 [Theileria equi strain WA]AFZ80813.1 hypothetical protein BEWA_002200 [Theileria equi strain WA]|eukprot:XP_004830479.1 hypothetical protein BEWA_002200 [Theileria equi strain WA]
MYSLLIIAIAGFCAAILTPSPREAMKSLYDVTFFTLDLEDSDGPYVTVETEVEGIPSILYFPKPGYVVEKIVQGKTEVWVAEHHELCFNPIVIFKDNNVHYMIIFSQSRDGYNLYIKRNVENQWKDSNEDYGAIMDSLRVEGDKRIKIDTAGDGRCSMFNIDNMLLVVPHTSYVATGVTHDGSYVWSALSGENCVFSTVNYESERPVSIRIFVRSHNNLFSHYLFINLNGTWLFIDRYDYKTKRKEKCTSAERERSVNPFILNISTPNQNTVNLHSYEYNGISYKAFSPKVTSFFNYVADGKQRLWRANEGEKAIVVWIYAGDESSLCRVNVVNSMNVVKSRFFEKSSNKWNKIEFSDFLGKLDKIIRGTSTNIRLDGAAVCPDTCNLMEYMEHGFLTKIVLPIWHYRVSSIYYDNRRIWEAEDDKECTLANFFIRNDKKFCFIMVKGKGDKIEDMFFECVDDKWKRVSSEAFFDFYDDPAKALESDIIGGLAIDISGNGDKVLRVTDHTLFGIRTRKYHPHPDIRVDEVRDGSNLIWKAKGQNERCLLSETYSSDNIKVVAIHNKTDDHFESIYYGNSGRGWDPIPKSRFEKMIKRMLSDASPDLQDSKISRTDKCMRSGAAGLSSEKAGRSSSDVEETTLDISSNESNNLAEKIDARMLSSPYLIFNSKAHQEIKKIVDGKITIWEAGNGRRCISASFLMINNKAAFAELLVNDEFTTFREYLGRTSHGWMYISSSSYESEVARLVGYSKSDGALVFAPIFSIIVPLVSLYF